jgi:hypothetical protein
MGYFKRIWSYYSFVDFLFNPPYEPLLLDLTTLHDEQKKEWRTEKQGNMRRSFREMRTESLQDSIAFQQQHQNILKVIVSKKCNRLHPWIKNACYAKTRFSLSVSWRSTLSCCIWCRSSHLFLSVCRIEQRWRWSSFILSRLNETTHSNVPLVCSQTDATLKNLANDEDDDQVWH